MQMAIEGFQWEKEEESLSGRGRQKAGDDLGVARKITE